jgi:hypothetical protein
MDQKRKTDDNNEELNAKKMKHEHEPDIQVQEEDLDPTLAWGRPKLPPIDPKKYALGEYSLTLSFRIVVFLTRN